MLGDAIGLPDARMMCDTPDCGYVQTVAPRSVREYVGAKCPRCAAVMVTEETAEKVEAGIALVDAFNAAFGPVEQVDSGLRVSARVDTEGDVAEVTLRKVSGP